MSKGFRVTVEDLSDGEKTSMVVGAGDYILIPFEPCHLANVQQYPGKGTVVLTIKDHKPQAVTE